MMAILSYIRYTDTFLEAPPVKKRKTGPGSSDVVPVEDDEEDDVANGDGDEDAHENNGVEDEKDSAEEEAPKAAAPASEATKEAPKEDDLKEVNGIVATDAKDE